MVQYKPSAQEILDRKSYGQGSRARFDPQWAMSRPTDWYTQSYDTGKSKIRNTDLINFQFQQKLLCDFLIQLFSFWF